MLWVNDKKINTAFGRLRDRRAAVGKTTTDEETPEQEAARIKQEIEEAQVRGDISTILSLVTSTSSLTTADFIKKTCGGLLFMYYTYVEILHARPVDIEDLIDGMLYLDARGYITKRHMDKERQQAGRR